MLVGHFPYGAPRVVLLTPRWGGGGEASWALRQLAGALACAAEVRVITAQESAPRQYRDGVFEVSELGTAPAPRIAVRHALLEISLASPAGTSPPTESWATTPADLAAAQGLFMSIQRGTWAPCRELLQSNRPDLVVIADYRMIAAAEEVERACPQVPVLAVPLASARVSVLSSFAPYFERAAISITFSESERSRLETALGTPRTKLLRVCLRPNPNVRAEAHPATGSGDSLLVRSGERWHSRTGPAARARMLVARFPSVRIALCATDRLTVHHMGETQDANPVERTADLTRLMASARATVDLAPGELIARSVLESLLEGTPVVVPASSDVAVEHAREARAGLWFEDGAQLFGCVEKVLDEEVRCGLSESGRRRTGLAHSEPDRFMEQVAEAVEEALSVVVRA